MNPPQQKVGCTRFPNMEAGQIGFTSKKGDKKAIAPHYPSQNGAAISYVHTSNQEELANLAAQVGAMNKNKFIEHNKTHLY